NKRGEKDAPRMGKLLRDHNLVPQVILSSTAVRCSQTAEAVADKIDYKNEVIYSPTLYLAEPQTYLDALQGLSDDVDCVLVVGHNPGLEGLVQILSGKVEPLPTAAIALIQMPIRSWQALDIQVEGKLVNLWQPKH
ncbi:MAG TPA: histidine phosphatase family protein, partial [Anaerolineaceae bacterium]|nr:histidine phosphatase family protein [Anaerolineaceae bacterium]